MIKKIFITSLIIFLVLPVLVLADKVILLDFDITREGEVNINWLSVIEGEAKEPTEGNYAIIVSDRVGKEISRTTFTISFQLAETLEELSERNILMTIPYSEDAHVISIEKDGSTIFHHLIESVCNYNFKCEDKENYASCPTDCISGSRDNYCDSMEDDRCDPDCAISGDKDCEKAAKQATARIGKKLFWLPGAIFVMIAAAIAILFIYLKKKKTRAVSVPKKVEKIKEPFNWRKYKWVLIAIAALVGLFLSIFLKGNKAIQQGSGSIDLLENYVTYYYNKEGYSCFDFGESELSSSKISWKCKGKDAMWRRMWVREIDVSGVDFVGFEADLTLKDHSKFFQECNGEGVKYNSYVDLILLSSDPRPALEKECNKEVPESEWLRCNIQHTGPEVISSCGMPKCKTSQKCSSGLTNVMDKETVYLVFKVADAWAFADIEGSLSKVKIKKHNPS